MTNIKTFISVLIICALIAAGIVYAVSGSPFFLSGVQTTVKQSETAASTESESATELTTEQAEVYEESEIYSDSVYSAGTHSYTTLPTAYAEDSLTNCMLACQFYNGRILSSGETIDFIGTLSREGGYSGMVYAPIITGSDGVDYGLGGGICAAAVAAGNAADGVEITAQGTEHTLRSIYVRDEDIDYTVSEGEVELYITNQTAYDYVIYMWVNDDGSVSASYSPI